jgi:hypothetical protein
LYQNIDENLPQEELAVKEETIDEIINNLNDYPSPVSDVKFIK